MPAGLAWRRGLIVVVLSPRSSALPGPFVAWLAVYLVATTLYSFWLKRKLLVDVIVLAVLYTLRIVAGRGGRAGAADDVAAGVLAVPLPEPRVCEAIRRAVEVEGAGGATFTAAGTASTTCGSSRASGRPADTWR